MERNIQTQNILGPLVGQTSGFSGAEVSPSYASTFNVAKEVLPIAAKIVNGIMQTANENAFLQGQADRASIDNTVTESARLIQESSWLTRDSYGQGVKYHDFSEDQLKTQQGISAQAAKSIDKGESIEQFTQKVKPNLAALNNKITEYGLTGKARDAALDEVVEYTVVAQKAYQAKLEQRTEALFNKEMANSSAGMVTQLSNTLDTGGAAQTMAAAWNSLVAKGESYDEVGGAEIAAKNLAAGLSQWSQRIVPGSELDYQRLNGALAFMHSPNTDNMPSDIKASIYKSLDTVRVQFNDQMHVQRVSTSRALKSQGDIQGVWNTDASYKNLTNTAMALAEHRATPAQFGEIEKAHYAMLAAANQGGGKNTLFQYGDSWDVANAGKSLKEQSTFLISDAINKYGKNPNVVVPFLMQEATARNNNVLMEAAAKLAMDPVVSALSSGDVEVLENASGTQSSSLDAVKSLWYQFGAEGSAHKQDALLNSVTDPYKRLAVGVLLKDHSSLGVSESATEFKTLYDNIKKGKSSDFNRARITIEDAEDNISVFGMQREGNSTSANARHQRHDSIQTRYFDDINVLLAQEQSSVMGAGHLYQDGDGAIRAALKTDLAVRTRDGIMAVPKDMYKTLSTTDSQGRPIYMSGTQVGTLVDTMKDRFIQDVGKIDPQLFGMYMTGVEPENVYAKFVGGNLLMQALDDSGNPVGQQMMYDRSDMLPFAAPQETPERTIMQGVRGVTLNGRVGATTEVTIQENKGSFPNNLVKQSILESMIKYEGYFDQLSKPNAIKKDANGREVEWSKGEYLIGNSVQYNTLVGTLGEEKAARYIALASDPSNAETQLLWDEFQEKYHAPLMPAIRAAGFPVDNDVQLRSMDLTGAGYRDYTKQYVAMADALYHGGVVV